MALKNNKSLGQHWLKDRQILDEIAILAAEGSGVAGGASLAADDAAAENGSHAAAADDVATSDATSRTPNLCLEIGPGLGTLTASLLRVFPKVLAVEFDPRLAANLPKSFPGKALEVVQADFLQFDLSTLGEPYVAAGNIPYYITSPIIKKLLTAPRRPERIVLLIQREVAQHIAAGPGKHSALSLYAQNLAEVYLGPVVPRELFTPAPKVDSQIILLEPRAQACVPPEVIKFAERGFSAPRKKLVHNLAFTGVGKEQLERALAELALSPDARPADLELADWAELGQRIKSGYSHETELSQM